jgi:hypothetical protein
MMVNKKDCENTEDDNMPNDDWDDQYSGIVIKDRDNGLMWPKRNPDALMADDWIVVNE